MTNTILISRFRTKTLPLLVSICLIVIVLPLTAQADNGYRKQINCDLHDSACVQRVGDTDITLEVSPRPVEAMKDLVFKVTLSSSDKVPSAAPHIDLNMPKMNMGKNQVKMNTVGPNVYEGNGVIVRCASGHRVWRATVTVPDLGKADFVFDVIY